MKVQSYHKFWQRMHSSAKDKGFPLRVMFELAYRCNFYCRHCYVPFRYRKHKELNTKEVFSILEQLQELGCFYLGFTGGEPFVREDIFEILWHAKRLGFELIIYTNGSLIDKSKADELARLRPNKVDITIPAVSKAAFERISGVFGSQEKVFAAIELLRQQGVNLGFKSCVLKENEAEIKAIQDFAASLGALHRLDSVLSRRLDGSGQPYKYRGNIIGREYVDANKRESKAKLGECQDKNISVNSRLFKCGVGVSQAAITPQGELKMCLMIDFPKYKILKQRARSKEQGAKSKEQRAEQVNLKKAWEKLKELVASIKPDEDYQCNKCELESYCNWCPARSWLKNRNFTACVAESQRWARLRRQMAERM